MNNVPQPIRSPVMSKSDIAFRGGTCPTVALKVLKDGYYYSTTIFYSLSVDVYAVQYCMIPWLACTVGEGKYRFSRKSMSGRIDFSVPPIVHFPSRTNESRE
jgi:hypothetical protein